MGFPGRPLTALAAFGVRQAWAALFGGLMLFGILITQIVELPWLARYDWLFVWALAIQILMLATGWERPWEVVVVTAFHLVGLGMELFKTSAGIGSWSYPGPAVIKLGNVPLFSGFMYAAVGSYLARSWRVLHLHYTGYPRRRWTVLLALASYLNFFTHHYVADLRWLLFAVLAVLYTRTWVSYTVAGRTRRMPLLVGFGLIAAVIWLAENLSTLTRVWVYPNQDRGWQPVGAGKLGSWLLLMVISFVMVDLLHRLAPSARVRAADSRPPRNAPRVGRSASIPVRSVDPTSAPVVSRAAKTGPTSAGVGGVRGSADVRRRLPG